MTIKQAMRTAANNYRCEGFCFCGELSGGGFKKEMTSRMRSDEHCESTLSSSNC